MRTTSDKPKKHALVLKE
ncbi:unnamed protein product [Cuscuta epithymum]|uniref:Uncharacterized protein n=1 Tax=Cuscuta epithymum TaxID=186058 RepID=A0AAV0FI59_9ASTE|nr:unnamed protein product [Cuscuta epithymum]